MSPQREIGELYFQQIANHFAVIWTHPQFLPLTTRKWNFCVWNRSCNFFCMKFHQKRSQKVSLLVIPGQNSLQSWRRRSWLSQVLWICWRRCFLQRRMEKRSSLPACDTADRLQSQRDPKTLFINSSNCWAYVLWLTVLHCWTSQNVVETWCATDWNTLWLWTIG